MPIKRKTSNPNCHAVLKIPYARWPTWHTQGPWLWSEAWVVSYIHHIQGSKKLATTHSDTVPKCYNHCHTSLCALSLLSVSFVCSNHIHQETIILSSLSSIASRAGSWPEQQQSTAAMLCHEGGYCCPFGLPVPGAHSAAHDGDQRVAFATSCPHSQSALWQVWLVHLSEAAARSPADISHWFVDLWQQQWWMSRYVSMYAECTRLE